MPHLTTEAVAACLLDLGLLTPELLIEALRTQEARRKELRSTLNTLDPDFPD